MLCIKKVISKKARGVSRSLAFDEFLTVTFGKLLHIILITLSGAKFIAKLSLASGISRRGS